MGTFTWKETFTICVLTIQLAWLALKDLPRQIRDKYTKVIHHFNLCALHLFTMRVLERKLANHLLTLLKILSKSQVSILKQSKFHMMNISAISLERTTLSQQDTMRRMVIFWQPLLMDCFTITYQIANTPTIGLNIFIKMDQLTFQQWCKSTHVTARTLNWQILMAGIAKYTKLKLSGPQGDNPMVKCMTWGCI